MRDVETYERRSIQVPLVLMLITITLMAIVVYLIYFGEPQRKVNPSEEAVEILNRAVSVFSDVNEYTRLKNANDEYARIVKSFSETNGELYDAYVSVSEENRLLKVYVSELETALVEATKLMDVVMEMLDGR